MKYATSTFSNKKNFGQLVFDGKLYEDKILMLMRCHTTRTHKEDCCKIFEESDPHIFNMCNEDEIINFVQENLDKFQTIKVEDAIYLMNAQDNDKHNSTTMKNRKTRNIKQAGSDKVGSQPTSNVDRAPTSQEYKSNGENSHEYDSKINNNRNASNVATPIINLKSETYTTEYSNLRTSQEDTNNAENSHKYDSNVENNSNALNVATPVINLKSETSTTETDNNSKIGLDVTMALPEHQQKSKFNSLDSVHACKDNIQTPSATHVPDITTPTLNASELNATYNHRETSKVALSIHISKTKSKSGTYDVVGDPAMMSEKTGTSRFLVINPFYNPFSSNPFCYEFGPTGGLMPYMHVSTQDASLLAEQDKTQYFCKPVSSSREYISSIQDEKSHKTIDAFNLQDLVRRTPATKNR